MLIDQSTAQVDTFRDAWRWAHFTTASGLPSNTVYGITEATDGTVWASTEAGLAWYDGFIWHPVGLSRGQQAARPLSLVSDSTGGVIAVVHFQVYRGDSSGFRMLDVETDGRPRAVRTALPFANNSVLLLAEVDGHSQLLVYSDSTTERLRTPEQLPGMRRTRLWMSGAGRVWLNAPGGLFYWNGTDWVTKSASHTSMRLISQLVEGSDGSGLAFVTAPTRLRGLWEWGPDSDMRLNLTEGDNETVAMALGTDGNALVVHETGHIRIRDAARRWSFLDPAPSQLRGALFVKYRTSGDLWIGSRNGLFLHRPRSNRWAGRAHQFPDPRNRVHALSLTQDRRDLWAGTADGVEIHKSDGTVEWIDQILGTRLGTVTGIAADSSGNMWISSGSQFQGAFRWDGARWRHFGSEDGLLAPHIHKVVVDREGRTWFLGEPELEPADAEGPGAFVYQDGQFLPWGREQGLPSGGVYSFAQGLDEALWFGTTAGLSRWRNGEWRHWGPIEGVRGKEVFAIAIENSGNIWFGQREWGLGHVDSNDELEFLTTADGLINDDVWDIQIDQHSDCIWITTHGGLTCYNRGAWSSFTTELGLANPYLWPALPTKFHIFLGTFGSGLQILSREEAGAPPPRVLVNEPLVEEDRVHVTWAPVAHWGAVDPAAIQTRYRVNDGPWSLWGHVQEANVTHVPPGAHTVEIQAMGLFGEHSEPGQTATFIVPPPVYLRPVFAIPVTSLLLALLVVGTLALRRKTRADAALRESESRLIAAQRIGKIGYLDWDMETGKLHLSDQFYSWLGLSRSQEPIAMETLSQFVHPEDLERVQESGRAAKENGKEPDLDHRLLAPDGGVIYVHVKGAIIKNSFGAPARMLITAVDITDRKQQEQELSANRERLEALSHSLINVEEKERARLARELHDEIGQALTAVKLNLHTVSRLSKNAAIDEQVSDSVAIVDKAVQEVRNMALDLRPSLLDDLGLEAALEWLADRQAKRANINSVFKADELRTRPDAGIETACFRVAQEAITNTVRHARATTVTVELLDLGPDLDLSIRDDGVGFELESATSWLPASGGLGLAGMRERVAIAGGTLTVQSAKGQGTVVRARFPIEQTAP
jgi:two-component system sensor histidine kinase UhpB